MRYRFFLKVQVLRGVRRRWHGAWRLPFTAVHPLSTIDEANDDAMTRLVLDPDALAVESFAALPAGDAKSAYPVAAAWSLPLQECFWTRLPTCEIHCVP